MQSCVFFRSGGAAGDGIPIASWGAEVYGCVGVFAMEGDVMGRGRDDAGFSGLHREGLPHGFQLDLAFHHDDGGQFAKRVLPDGSGPRDEAHGQAWGRLEFLAVERFLAPWGICGFVYGDRAVIVVCRVKMDVLEGFVGVDLARDTVGIEIS